MPLKHQDREMLSDFIQNREYGVALEWLHSLVVERSLEATLTQENEIERLARLMNISLGAAS
jgi:hypothetical protein